MSANKVIAMIGCLICASCGRMDEIGKAPSFTEIEGGYQHHAMYTAPFPEVADRNAPADAASLWTATTRTSLFGDRRASRRGDILRNV